MQSKRKQRERKQHLAVACVSLLVFAILPAIGLLTLLPLNHSPNTKHGISRPQAGQTAIIDEKVVGARENRYILAGETLNARVTKTILKDPPQAFLLTEKSEEEVIEMLARTEELDPAPLKEILKTAREGGVRWNPTAGPWGLFLLPRDRAPATGIPYGIVSLPYGAEKTRKETEEVLNKLCFQFGMSSGLMEILQAGVAEEVISPEAALNVLAAAQILNITYIPQKGLFFSSKTLEDWEETQPKIFGLNL